MRRNSTVLATAVLAAAAALSGCGGDDSNKTGLAADASPAVTNGDGDLLLTCGGSDSTVSTADADGCDQPVPAVKDGQSWVAVLAVSGDVTADASNFKIEVVEHDCTGGGNPTDALHAPFVVTTADAVTLYMAMDTPAGGDASPPQGDARYCEGNPAIYGNVDLGEPLGKRALYDGSTWPPTKIADAPSS